MILTGDQNVIDLAYTVRWNIKNPELFLFQMADPEATIREVAESAMRAVVARVVARRRDRRRPRRHRAAGRSSAMQQVLDDYGSGVQIQGVAINQSTPPASGQRGVLAVSAAQQRAQSAMNQARAYALQQIRRAPRATAAEFDKIYAAISRSRPK